MNNNIFFLSTKFCMHNGAVILNQNEDCVSVGLLDFNNEELKERISKAVINHSGKSCAFVKISKKDFSKLMGNTFTKNKSDEKSVNNSTVEEEKENAAKMLLESLIERACAAGATDIHIEEDGIRFRILGNLYDEIVLDEKNVSYLIQRIKLISRMNVSQKRKGQDGQFVYGKNGRCIFVRVSCIPVVRKNEKSCSESIVMRLLDPSRVALKIDNLGFNKNQINQLKNICLLNDGLILICGPTGSGKSTTACAMLQEIKCISENKRKIISLEDPPEYYLPGITQIPISEESNDSFHEELRFVFRHDPDVIMIGEIRDEVTCNAAFQAALTGHLVFATLHAGSFKQAKGRIRSLGAEKDVVEEIIKCIIIQHLVDGKLKAEIEYEK